MTNSTRTSLSSSRASLTPRPAADSRPTHRIATAAPAPESQERRRLLAAGPIVPVLFAIVTIAVASALGQPLRTPVDVAALLGWLGFTAVLVLPFVASLIVMLTARRGGLVWFTTLIYSLVAGVLGLGVDLSVLASESSTAALGLVSTVVVQAVLLAPIAATIAFIVNIVRQRGREQNGRDQRG
ncbi:MAG: hypothetical protein ACTIC1_16920 [Brevibacterium sp.]